MKLTSEMEQILTYIVNGETDRLAQSEWVNIANKLLPKKLWVKPEYPQFDGYVGLDGMRNFIYEFVKRNEISPSLREIKDVMADISSIRGVTVRLDKLEVMGCIKRVGKGKMRNISVTNSTLPIEERTNK